VHDNCLAKDPADRYVDGSELLAALRAVQSGTRVRRHTKPRSSLARAALGALAGAALLAAGWGAGRGRGDGIPARPAAIAVLPVRDTSVATETGYFGDGVAEALIERLGTIESLRVFSRESTMRFRDERALASIKRDLSADMVVRGSLRRTTDRIR